MRVSSEALAKEDWSFGGLRRNIGATGSCPWGSTCRMLKNTFLSSFPRRRESRNGRKEWIPACAGMTSEGRAEKSAVYLAS